MTELLENVQLMFLFFDRFQRWQKSGTHLEHLVSRFCLDSEMALDGMDSSRMLVISPCELSAYTQRWEVPFSWPRAPTPIHSLKDLDLDRDSCSDSDEARARRVKVLRWRRLFDPLHCSSPEDVERASVGSGSKRLKEDTRQSCWLVLSGD